MRTSFIEKKECKLVNYRRSRRQFHTEEREKRQHIARKEIYDGPAAKNMFFNSCDLIEIKDLLFLASPEGLWSFSLSCTWATYQSYLRWQQFKSVILDTVIAAVCTLIKSEAAFCRTLHTDVRIIWLRGAWKPGSCNESSWNWANHTLGPEEINILQFHNFILLLFNFMKPRGIPSSEVLLHRQHLNHTLYFSQWPPRKVTAWLEHQPTRVPPWFNLVFKHIKFSFRPRKPVGTTC